MSKILLQSETSQCFAIDVKAAILSESIEKWLENNEPALCDEEDTPIFKCPNVTSEILQKVIEWCEYHKDDPEPEPLPVPRVRKLKYDDLSNWDKEFCNVPLSIYVPLKRAAKTMEIPSLILTLAAARRNHIKMARQSKINEGSEN